MLDVTCSSLHYSLLAFSQPQPINVSQYNITVALKLKQSEQQGVSGRATFSSTGTHPTSDSESHAYYSHEYSVPQTNELTDQGAFSVVRVHQRITVEGDDEYHYNTNGIGNNNNGDNASTSTNGDNDTVNASNTHTQQTQQTQSNDGQNQTIWALIEYEHNQAETTEALIPTKRFQRWRKFISDNALADHVRRNTGEPIHLPPHSLSPAQSQHMEEEARQAVAHVTEEYRRFRVRAEVARKQTDATMRAMQSNNVQTAQKHIEGQDLLSELEQAKQDHEQVNFLRAELVEQEAQWKEAYDTLLHENNSLKSSGSEALLAAQWRQRYENCLMEKEKAETSLDMERERFGKNSHDRKKEDAGKFESKYKDLKESFRIYRKKAKEIFEAQQKGEVAMLHNMGDDTNSEDAKLSYLRNLMVNYLSSDPAVREHMEGAIGTVLKFTSDDCGKISKQKKLHQEGSSSWFG